MKTKEFYIAAQFKTSDTAKELESWVGNAHRAKHRCFVLLERWANCLLSSDWKEGDPKGPIALASGRLVVKEALGEWRAEQPGERGLLELGRAPARGR